MLSFVLVLVRVCVLLYFSDSKRMSYDFTRNMPTVTTAESFARTTTAAATRVAAKVRPGRLP